MADEPKTEEVLMMDQEDVDASPKIVACDFGAGTNPVLVRGNDRNHYEHGDDLDAEFNQGGFVEVQFDDDDEPMENDDEMQEEGEVGFVDGDDDDAPLGPDESAALVWHQDAVLCVAVSPADPRLVATGGQDDLAVLWEISEGPSGELKEDEEKGSGLRMIQKRKLEGHNDSVVTVSFGFDGQYLATAGYDSTVKVWAASTGELLHTLEGPSKEVEWLTWHPKGHALLAGSADTTAWMWWAPSGKVMQVFAGHSEAVSCGCFCAAGKLILTGSTDGGLIVWEPRSGQAKHHMRKHHSAGVNTVSAHREQAVVVTGSEDSTVKVVQVETGKELAVLGGHNDSVEAVVFSLADNKVPLFATAGMDGKVQFFDSSSFELRVASSIPEGGGIVGIKWVSALPETCHLLTTCSTDKGVRLFDGLSGACLRTLTGHVDTVLCVEATVHKPSGSLWVLSGSDDKSCRLFVCPNIAGASLAKASQASEQSPTGAGTSNAGGAGGGYAAPSAAVQSAAVSGLPNSLPRTAAGADLATQNKNGAASAATSN